MTESSYQLPVMDTIKLAWAKVYGAKASIWAAFGIVFAVMFCFGLIDGALKSAAPNIEPFYVFIIEIIGFLLQMGVLYIGIKRAQDLPITFKQMFRSFESGIALRIIGLYLLQVLILLIPILVLITGVILMSNANPAPYSFAVGIPVVLIALFAILYLAVRMMVSMSFVLDKGVGPLSAMKLSFAATRSNFWRIMGVISLQSLIVLVSMIPLGIGLIWTLPFANITYGMIYRHLADHNLLAP